MGMESAARAHRNKGNAKFIDNKAKKKSIDLSRYNLIVPNDFFASIAGRQLCFSADLWAKEVFTEKGMSENRRSIRLE